MAHFAKLNENNVVLQVLVVDNNELLDETGQESEQKGIDFLISWSGGYTNWKQTSYNGTFRKNYAGINYVYDTDRDVFIPPKPFNNWILDEVKCIWVPPVPHPAPDGNEYAWNQETTSWDNLGPVPTPPPDSQE